MSLGSSKLPNLIIAGVHKAGTTSLFNYLSRHPSICGSFTKEIGFFAPLMFGREMSSLDEYAVHFGHCGFEKYRLEASPSYIYGKEIIASRIRELLPDARIIIVLRDPTDRLISFFSRAVSKSVLPAPMTLAEYVTRSEQAKELADHDVYSRGLREGMYINYLRPWQAEFGSRLNVVFFDSLAGSTHKLMADLCRWLEIDSGYYDDQVFAVANRTTQYRRRGLHKQVQRYYMKSEAFWRRHAKLKDSLRAVYNIFNANKAKSPVRSDDGAIATIRKLYEPYNAELKSFLIESGYSRLPVWLDETPAT